MTRNTIGT